MSSKWLDNKLFCLNDVEKLQKESNGNVNYMDLNFIKNPIPKMPMYNFFQNGDIAITKNNRFSYVPAHTHSFIELNYMYHGTCTQYINGERIIMHTNDLILLDKDIVQQIDYTSQDDIIVNILIKDDNTINTLFDYISVSTNEITQFLNNSARINTLHNNFILFNLSNNDVSVRLIESLIIEGLDSNRLRSKTMNLILSALILKLSQSIEQEYVNFVKTNDDNLLPIITYINKNFANISLAELSQKFGYNTNYLGNKIKNATGRTFKELVERRRLSAAQNLMIKTNCTISEICNLVGYQNTSSLFRLFKKYLQTTPSDYKKQLKLTKKR
ncbi:AraC family transcriptional regulator [Bombilactobacillus bombi]|uniref:AraC family transcriptional regulator n=1 Tax=Bombilactobacillus bombi TaxID=1303590 RepID=A0A417ZJE6_9LACO|nr:AraC family transcriptional regulator [Bombilactobacillus bombi]RHW52100.1 AraC family transcriptional regulator [Bombilactobacillus bombi]